MTEEFQFNSKAWEQTLQEMRQRCHGPCPLQILSPRELALDLLRMMGSSKRTWPVVTLE